MISLYEGHYLFDICKMFSQSESFQERKYDNTCKSLWYLWAVLRPVQSNVGGNKREIMWNEKGEEKSKSESEMWKWIAKSSDVAPYAIYHDAALRKDTPNVLKDT